MLALEQENIYYVNFVLHRLIKVAQTTEPPFPIHDETENFNEDLFKHVRCLKRNIMQHSYIASDPTFHFPFLQDCSFALEITSETGSDEQTTFILRIQIFLTSTRCETSGGSKRLLRAIDQNVQNVVAILIVDLDMKSWMLVVV